MTTALGRLSAETTNEICAGLEFSDDAKPLLEDKRLDLQLPPAAFLDALVEHSLFPDALRFLAGALPKRESVWWSCCCVREVAKDPGALPCLMAAEAWVRDPTDELRRAAMKLAEAAEFGTADAWSAVAAFWSEGSIAPPDVPDVPPPDGLTGHAVSGAVQLAVVQDEPEKAEEKQRSFVAAAIDISNGLRLWAAASREKE